MSKKQASGSATQLPLWVGFVNIPVDEVILQHYNERLQKSFQEQFIALVDVALPLGYRFILDADMEKEEWTAALYGIKLDCINSGMKLTATNESGWEAILLLCAKLDYLGWDSWRGHMRDVNRSKMR